MEAASSSYDSLADAFEAKAKLLGQKPGHSYVLYAYDGHPEATRVMVVMGSGAVTCSEATAYLAKEKGQRGGVLKARLIGPWGQRRFLLPCRSP